MILKQQEKEDAFWKDENPEQIRKQERKVFTFPYKNSSPIGY